MLTGPRTPRASRLMRLSTSPLSGSARKARAPTSPSSSPSLKSRMTGRFSDWPFRSAATSRSVATPAPSSDAAGPTGVLSQCALRSSALPVAGPIVLPKRRGLHEQAFGRHCSEQRQKHHGKEQNRSPHAPPLDRAKARAISLSERACDRRCRSAFGEDEMGYRVAVVGATGNVGREILNILAERQFPLDELAAVASARSTGD